MAKHILPANPNCEIEYPHPIPSPHHPTTPPLPPSPDHMLTHMHTIMEMRKGLIKMTGIMLSYLQVTVIWLPGGKMIHIRARQRPER